MINYIRVYALEKLSYEPRVLKNTTDLVLKMSKIKEEKLQKVLGNLV